MISASISSLVVAIGCQGPGPAPIADWLVDEIHQPVMQRDSEISDQIVMENGLIRREFRLRPDLATVGFDNLMTQHAMLRAVLLK